MFDVKFTREGCLADIGLKPNNEENDLNDNEFSDLDDLELFKLDLDDEKKINFEQHKFRKK